jgi:hypothetical protein
MRGAATVTIVMFFFAAIAVNFVFARSVRVRTQVPWLRGFREFST